MHPSTSGIPRPADPRRVPEVVGLSVGIHGASGLTVCAPAGVVDDRSVSRLVDGSRTAFWVRPGASVVLDLGGVSWLAPRAVNAMVGAARWARQRSGRRLVCGFSGHSSPALDMGRLHMPSVFPDLPSATAAATGASRQPGLVTGDVAVGGRR